jgi:hypothetical protein
MLFTLVLIVRYLNVRYQNYKLQVVQKSTHRLHHSYVVLFSHSVVDNSALNLGTTSKIPKI